MQNAVNHCGLRHQHEESDSHVLSVLVTRAAWAEPFANVTPVHGEIVSDTRPSAVKRGTNMLGVDGVNLHIELSVDTLILSRPAGFAVHVQVAAGGLKHGPAAIVVALYPRCV